MNIFRSYKRTRLFLWVNIAGLAVGLAVSTLLILFVASELTYDKCIPDNERIISLNTVMERNGESQCLPIATRKALTEIPGKIPGIEYATQAYRINTTDIRYNNELYADLPALETEAGFCDVFSVELTEGNKDDLNKPAALFITEKYARLIFGSSSNALHQTVQIGDSEYTVYGVMKNRTGNTHFHFEALITLSEFMKAQPSIEFYTFYKLKKEVDQAEVRAAIEKEYTVLVSEFLRGFSGKAFGKTERFSELYLKSEATSTLGKRSSMGFVYLLSGIASFILLLVITNFVNLFIAQGETRMLEIGIRKTNGASGKDLARQFIGEIGWVILFSFALGMLLLTIALPYFSALIKRQMETEQLLHPVFIGTALCILGITWLLSAAYPVFYLLRFNTLDILTRRVRFSRRRLTSAIVVFQSVVSLILITSILIVSRQISYLEEQDLAYNPNNVVVLSMNRNLHQEYNTLYQELLKRPDIQSVSRANHIFGSGCSGQSIALLGQESQESINEYRIDWEIPEMLELQLVEGRFYQHDDPNNHQSILLNEAAIRMLGLTYPVVGTTVDYKGEKEIRGVVKDFYYGQLEDLIQPIVLSYQPEGYSIYIKLAEHLSRQEATAQVLNVVKGIDSEYPVTNMLWLEDVYRQKFESLNVQSRIFLLSSILSVFISMIGLLAIHSFSVSRRTKEVGIRRVNGATGTSIFLLLTKEIIKWILIAGVVALPCAYFMGKEWLSHYPNHVPLSGLIFLLPFFLQVLIAVITTSGVSLRALRVNPVETIKTE